MASADEGTPPGGSDEGRAAGPPPVARRDPAAVMRLARLGAFHQTRLSFMRQLTRRLQRERWTFSRAVFEVDANGVGHAVLCAHGPERSYSLVAFAHDLPAGQRSDRVIAEAWDATFALFDGVPDEADVARLAANVPRQEAGRIAQTELTLSRANRSVRLWEYVLESLASGRQPELARIDEVGYLMRTTAVYGSGKFGACDRENVAARAELAAPFQAEMLTVYLIRAFVRDLVEHMARSRGGSAAVPLAPEVARRIGIGNSTGLGMAPFIVNHPRLFDRWIGAREEALARVRGVERASEAARASFRELLERSIESAARWHSAHPLQRERIAGLREDLDALRAHVGAAATLEGTRPWDRLYRHAAGTLGMECQECLVSLLLEPYGELVDGLADTMADDVAAEPPIDGRATVGKMRRVLEAVHGWALGLDWDDREQIARAWYVSAEKLEPRLGERFEEPIAPYEQPLAPARDAVALHRALAGLPDEAPVAGFLLAHPEHRHALRRLQTVARAPYAEIRDNTISSSVMPIDMLRAKLSFFGAVHFDPRSDRWVRICLYGNAPYPEELAEGEADRWPYPPLASPAEAGGVDALDPHASRGRIPA